MDRAVLLRCQVPKDVDRVKFYTLEENDDMWTHLFFNTCDKLGVKQSEIWMYGGFRYHHYEQNKLEQWFHDFRGEREDKFNTPDLIMNKGGFKDYIPVMEKYPNAFKIYWGSKRYSPKLVPDTTKYDLVLASTNRDIEKIRADGYTAYLLIKPAADHIFRPVGTSKKYDVVFIANAPQKKIKGHKWLFRELKGSNLRILQIGKVDDEVMGWAKENELDITFTGWIPRREIPFRACAAKVGVVASTDYESCPRIIPEYLAMNLPIVVRHTVRVNWLYVNKHTGAFAEKSSFAQTVREVLQNYRSYAPYRYYKTHLSMDKASTHLAELIKGML